MLLHAEPLSKIITCNARLGVIRHLKTTISYSPSSSQSITTFRCLQFNIASLAAPAYESLCPSSEQAASVVAILDSDRQGEGEDLLEAAWGLEPLSGIVSIDAFLMMYLVLR